MNFFILILSKKAYRRKFQIMSKPDHCTNCADNTVRQTPQKNNFYLGLVIDVDEKDDHRRSGNCIFEEDSGTVDVPFSIVNAICVWDLLL